MVLDDTAEFLRSYYALTLPVGSTLRVTLLAGFGTVILLILTAIVRLLPKLEEGEPPLLKPNIPAVGHLIRMQRDQTQFLRRLK
jgi:hypothetical protein